MKLTRPQKKHIGYGLIALGLTLAIAGGVGLGFTAGISAPLAISGINLVIIGITAVLVTGMGTAGIGLLTIRANRDTNQDLHRDGDLTRPASTNCYASNALRGTAKSSTAPSPTNNWSVLGNVFSGTCRFFSDVAAAITSGPQHKGWAQPGM